MNGMGSRRKLKKVHWICEECKENEHREGIISGEGNCEVNGWKFGERWGKTGKDVKGGR